MHLRRALILFAIVLGLAAVVTSVEGPSRSTKRESAPLEPPTASPASSVPTGRLARLRFDSPAHKPVERRLAPGRGAVVSVSVRSAGLVTLAGLGQSISAEPLTPARFEVLVPDPGRHDVLYRSADGGPAKRIGTIVVGPAQAGTSSRRSAAALAAASGGAVSVR